MSTLVGALNCSRASHSHIPHTAPAVLGTRSSLSVGRWGPRVPNTSEHRAVYSPHRRHERRIHLRPVDRVAVRLSQSEFVCGGGVPEAHARLRLSPSSPLPPDFLPPPSQCPQLRRPHALCPTPADRPSMKLFHRKMEPWEVVEQKTVDPVPIFNTDEREGARGFLLVVLAASPSNPLRQRRRPASGSGGRQTGGGAAMG